jgi:hypothetical protein
METFMSNIQSQDVREMTPIDASAVEELVLDLRSNTAGKDGSPYLVMIALAAATLLEQQSARLQELEKAAWPVDTHGNPITQEFHETAMRMLSEAKARLQEQAARVDELERDITNWGRFCTGRNGSQMSCGYYVQQAALSADAAGGEK